MRFEQLIKDIEKIQKELLNRTAAQINTNLSIRNWMIGLYIVRYELHGEDRANYGDRLFDELPTRLKKNKLKGLSATNLRLCRQFYKVYPQMGQITNRLLQEGNIELPKPIHQSLTDELKNAVIHKEKSSSPDNDHYYVDMVFYHKYLRCQVLIGLRARPIFTVCIVFFVLSSERSKSLAADLGFVVAYGFMFIEKNRERK